MAAALVGWLRVLLSIVLLAAMPGAANIALAAPDWKIVVEPSTKIRANYPSEMRVRISNAKGQPVSGATVELVANMIDMDHGEHKSPTTMTAPGVYDGKVNFFMSGAWSLDVRVKKGSETFTHKARFDIKD